MGKQPQARKRRYINRHKTRLRKTKNYRKNNLQDLDEVHDTINRSENNKPIQIKSDANESKAEIDELPGLGQFHCLECRYFNEFYFFISIGFIFLGVLIQSSLLI